MQFLRGGWVGSAQRAGDFDIPASIFPHIGDGFLRMQSGQNQLAIFIGFQDAQIGDHGLGPTAPQVSARSLRSATQEAGRGAEVDLLWETPLLVGRNDVAAIGPGGNFHRAARAGQPHLGIVMIADHSRINIAVAVDFGSAQETVVHIPAL